MSSFTCPRCGVTSYLPKDIEEGYCGNCHDWTGAAMTERPEFDATAIASDAAEVFVSLVRRNLAHARCDDHLASALTTVEGTPICVIHLDAPDDRYTCDHGHALATPATFLIYRLIDVIDDVIMRAEVHRHGGPSCG